MSSGWRGAERRRMAVALLALVGVLVSLYLLLYKLGFYGQLACGTGSCASVQASRFGVFLGVPVAGWGVAWYLAVLGVALAGVSRRAPDPARADRWIGWLALGGLAFTAYLTWAELFVLHAVCRWCVGSAVLVLAIAVLGGRNLLRR